MPQNLYRFILAPLLCFFVASVSAEDRERVLVLGDSASTLSAAPYLDVLEDTTRRLTLAEVMSPGYADKFIANAQETPSLGRSYSAFWVRFELINHSTLTWYLLLDSLLGDQLDLFVISGHASNVTAASTKRQEHYRRPLWLLQVPQGQKLRFYIRATNGGAILNLPVELLTADAILTRSNHDYRLHTIIYAALLTLVVYNFFLFFILREASYLTLIVHSLSVVVTMHRHNPVFESLAFFSQTSNYFFTSPVFVLLGSLSLFTRQILRTKLYAPKFDRVLNIITWLSILCIPIVGTMPIRTLIPALLAFILFVVILLASWFVSQKGETIATYFFFIFLIVASIDIPILLMVIFSATHWDHAGSMLSIGTAIFTLLLSLIQAERVRLMRENMQRLKSAGEAKDSFLASMSHELRTPLNAIFGLSTLLQLSNLDDKQRSYVKKLEASSRYMLQLIGNILDIKKIESKSFQMEHKPFVLKTVLASIYDLLHGQAQPKGLNLIFTDIAEITVPLLGDRVRLSQVLINLLGNSIKYTQQGGVTLIVEKLNPPPDPKKLFLRFDIIDTGIGIAQDKMNILFEPFVQLESKTPYFQEGVGLGLAISKNLVELMGGTLEVESVPGKGSHFFFSVPFGVYRQIAGPDQGIVPGSKVLLPGTRILLVDDYELNAFIWRKLINSIGGSVAVALDGQSTILQLQQNIFDVVLMDISLPDMNGFEVTRWIRQHSQNPEVPIIALTAHATPVVEQECKDAGMNGFLSKPFELRDLFAIIYRTLYEKP